MDNVSNNKTMMESLKNLLAVRDIVIDATDRRIMCFAHVINLCSGWVINAISKGANNDNDLSSGGDIIATDPRGGSGSSPSHSRNQGSSICLQWHYQKWQRKGVVQDRGVTCAYSTQRAAAPV